jgi:membrane protease YdiL (CAAX protease family)
MSHFMVTCGGFVNKFLQFPPIRIAIAILFTVVGVTIGQLVLNLLRSVLSIKDTAIANMLAFVIITPLAYFAYSLYVRLLEKRELTELGFSNAWQEFGLGLLLGLGLFAVIITILWLLGFYHVAGVDLVILSLIGALLGAVVSALAQELIFRAVIYRIVEQWIGTWWALGISALLFGLIHLTSAGATLFSALAVALQAGIVLGAAYALTHRLWMALGIHMAWDFANDGIFGVGVAGQSGAALKGLLQANLSGPALVTGGNLGVEASIITLVIMLLAGVLILWKAYQNGQITLRKKPVSATA